MNYFDIAIVAIVSLGALIGFAKGFFKTLASLFGWIISLIIAILLAKTVANALLGVSAVSDLFFGEGESFSFYKWIYGILPENLRIDMDIVRRWVIVDGSVVSGAPDILVEHISKENKIMGIFLGLFKDSYVSALVSPEMLSHNTENLAQGISILLSNSLLVMFTGVLLLIMFKIIASIIVKLFEKKIYAVGERKSIINRTLGMALGAGKGIVVCSAIFVVLSFVINFPFMDTPRKMLFEEESIVAETFAKEVFAGTDKLLKTEDLKKLMKGTPFQDTIDLSAISGEDETDPDYDGSDSAEEPAAESAFRKYDVYSFAQAGAVFPL